MPPRTGSQQVQSLFLQVSEGRLLGGQEACERLASLTSSFEDRVIEGCLEAQVLQILMGVLNDAKYDLMAIVRADVIDSQMGQKGAELRAKRNAVDDPLSNQVVRQSSLCLNQPELKVPDVLFIVLLWHVTAPGWSGVHFVVHILFLAST